MDRRNTKMGHMLAPVLRTDKKLSLRSKLSNRRSDIKNFSEPSIWSSCTQIRDIHLICLLRRKSGAKFSYFHLSGRLFLSFPDVFCLRKTWIQTLPQNHFYTFNTALLKKGFPFEIYNFNFKLYLADNFISWNDFWNEAFHLPDKSFLIVEFDKYSPVPRLILSHYCVLLYAI